MEELFYKYEGRVRIDIFLSNHYGYSRNFFENIIQRGGISVNNQVVKKSYKLKDGDKINIGDIERFSSPGILEEANFIELDILKEKKDYIVVYKPSGVLSHPNSVRDMSIPSVVGFLYNRYKNIPSMGNFIRAGLVHRLDKDTSGPMIVVKTEKGLSHFNDLFYRKSIEENLDKKEQIPLRKIYNAICEKNENDFFNKLKGKLPYYINEAVIPKIPYKGNLKNGITKILNYYEYDKEVEFDIEILTGRTHQIRYHLSSKGLPIIGDKLYGSSIESKEMKLKCNLLEFNDSEGEYISIKN